MYDYKSCIKCGRQARLSEAFGEWVCYNQKCKHREFNDVPNFVIEVRIANDWWSSLKNEEKLEILEIYSKHRKTELTDKPSTHANTLNVSANIEKPSLE